MRIVVTGASGQLGSYLIDLLIERPHEIVAWSGGTTETRGEITLRPVELTESYAVLRALAMRTRCHDSCRRGQLGRSGPPEPFAKPGCERRARPSSSLSGRRSTIAD